MNIVHTIEQTRQAVDRARRQDQTIGLVPTMGALHAGHGSLIQRAKSECGFVVVSIFVNPTQFGPNEDFEKYPRTLEADAGLCEALGADLIFAPSAQEMYPQPQLAWVDVAGLTEGLCGASRPGHFRGVTTVCTKLFGIVRPDIAFFGQKDAQQALVLCRMVRDLNLPLDIRICPIVRDADGLALSSRNRYLSGPQRQQALCLYKALNLCRDKLIAGERDTAELIDGMKAVIEQHSGRVDYVSIVDTDTLQPLQRIDGSALAALAVYIGTTRLIDNFWIDLNNLQKTV
jgi:pantoate--beta-alanine ligase